MHINISYEEDFKKDFNKLKKLPFATELMELDGIGTQLDIQKFSADFFSKKGVTTADVSVDSNSNVDAPTVVHYNIEVGKPIQRLNAYYLLWKYGKLKFGHEFALGALKKQLTKEIYINDFHGFMQSYCYNFSCMDVVCLGLPFVTKIKSTPPKHLSSFVGQVSQFLSYSSNVVLGAVGLSDFLICCAYFVELMFDQYKNIPKEYLEKQIKQELQSFIFTANQPFRSGVQSPFTNVSVFDGFFLDKLCSEYVFPNGEKVSKDTVIYVQSMFVDLMNETLRETQCTFPVTTACFSTNAEGKIQDQEFLKYISEKNAEFGFMNIYAGKTSTYSSCCRLRSDGVNEYFNAFGSGSSKLGSVGVVTLNLPRLAYLSKTKEEFVERFEANIRLASRINHVRRSIVEKRIKAGHSPLYSLGFIDLKTQYSTCGLCGIYEAIEILGMNLLETEGEKFLIELLDIANRTNEVQSKKYKYPHNIEQVPAENSSINLLNADKILGYNTKYDLYSNQFVPLIHEADLMDRIRLQGAFDKHMTGGAICHINLVDTIPPKYMEKLIEFAVASGVIYHAVNFNLQKCFSGCITVGKRDTCPKCGAQITDNFIRVVGFLVNVKNFHKTRREKDYPSRQFYRGENLLGDEK